MSTAMEPEQVPLSATMKLVDALVEAEKDFELLVLPGRNHGFGAEPYFVRRRWDFFVQHLMEKAPPSRHATAASSSSS